MIDGSIEMTESVAMSQYILDKYGPSKLKVDKTEDDYGNAVSEQIFRCYERASEDAFLAAFLKHLSLNLNRARMHEDCSGASADTAKMIQFV